jgi:hypothetical protein
MVTDAMNAPESPFSPNIPGPSLAETLVLTGLSLFAEKCLERVPDWVAELASTRQLQGVLQLPHRSWSEISEVLQRRMPGLPGVLGRVVRDFNLHSVDFFMLSLCGLVESQHRTALLLGLLQQPESLRPELHLVCALSRSLFGCEYTPPDLLQHRLVSCGLLQVEGDEPLPLQRLKIVPQLWQLLNDKAVGWPGCRELAVPDQLVLPEDLARRSEPLLRMLEQGYIAGIVLRGERESGLVFAGKLALESGLKPMVIDVPAYQDKQLGLLVRYGYWLPILKPQLGPGEHLSLPDALAGLPVVVVIGRDGNIDAPGCIEMTLPGLPAVQRRDLWRRLLPDYDSARIAETARLSAPAIIAIAEQAQLQALQQQRSVQDDHLLRARFLESNEQLRLLAQPVERQIEDDMLVLPPHVSEQLEHLILRCRRREHLSAGLGRSVTGIDGCGVRALFIGESGTGKTLAAGFLASSFSAPLYRVDLAAVMNKYIGETEKNLGLMLDQAADHDVVLLLDEADALFGKRSDGGEVGERFANMLTNFLLTRIEQHPGIVILTSNSQSRIDKAFMRRLDAVLEFPLPDAEQRRRLWKNHLGSRSPGDDFVTLLAQYCELPGGYIRNAVLNAAVYPGGTLGRAAILQALAWEYQKLGRQLPAQLDRFRGE